jgi:hypothetical protein
MPKTLLKDGYMVHVDVGPGVEFFVKDVIIISHVNPRIAYVKEFIEPMAGVPWFTESYLEASIIVEACENLLPGSMVECVDAVKSVVTTTTISIFNGDLHVPIWEIDYDPA